MRASVALTSLEYTAKQAVIMRILAHMLPRCAASFSDGTTLGYRS